MTAQILIVDDEQDIRYSLKGILEDEGYGVLTAASGEEAVTSLEKEMVDLVLLDIWLPGIDGLEVLTRIREKTEDLPVIMISGHGNIETAVSAMNKGASDFIEKPLSLEKVIVSVNKSLEFRRIQQENLALKTRIEDDQVNELTGQSEPIKALRMHINQVAPTDTWVLITGENGTGKEIVARSIHFKSKRADKPLVALNCAAIPEELIESELFGHVKGAFTGAETSKTGKFELAHRGTLFLDEIGDMSLKTQAKILRILQEQSFEAVGGHKTIRVDVRVIAATNKDLPAEIRAGNFREDLYYRLKVFPLDVPPLRERSMDIPLLVDEFVAEMCRKHAFKPLRFTARALDVLKAARWGGNVRELKNFVERMMILHAGTEVGPEQLPTEFEQAVPEQDQGSKDIPEGAYDFKVARSEFEAKFLKRKYNEFEGNISRMADAIGMERSYLYRKLRGYGIQITD